VSLTSPQQVGNNFPVYGETCVMDFGLKTHGCTTGWRDCATHVR